MKDFSLNDIFASVKCEFVRRCTHSEVILSRLADDFIARYSAKPYTHPQFFKEDTTLTCNQLTMYADECVQVMRKFDFLQRGADIVHSLSSSALRLLDFFAKQLYHHLRDTPPKTVTAVQDSLCPSCCRLRENERVRSLREELNMGAVWEEARAMREMVVRHGEKYDEEELLCESLESLEVLNEEEIRKRLGKMEADHDKHKKEILVAVQELTRANERVSTYSRALQKSGKEFSGKFNVKDYVFQLGRHFFHNISSLDSKIRLLKQSLSPVEHSETQTDQPVLLQSKHKMVVATILAETQKIKGTLTDTIQSLTVERNKNAELHQMNALLQKKLQESDVRRQQQKIQQKVNSTQITSNLSAAQSKVAMLEAIIKKFKGSKSKHNIVDPITAKQEELIQSEDKLSTCRQQSVLSKSHRNNASKASTCPLREKESFLINPKALLRLSLNRSNSALKIAVQQFTDRLTEIMPAAPQLLAQICEQARMRCALVSTVNQCFIPTQNPVSLKEISRKVSRKGLGNPHESLHVSEVASRIDLNEKERNSEMQAIHHKDHREHKQRKKLSKLDLFKPDHIRSSNHRESIYIDETFDITKKKATQRANQIAFQDLRNTFEEKSKLPTKKMLGTLKTSHALQTFKSLNDKQTIKKQLAERIVLEKRNKHKKTRNLSQENSYEQQQYQEYRRSIQKMDYKERIWLGQKEKHLLLSPNDVQSRLPFKNSLHRAGEGTRVVLSLEEINYSTYFYSLLASIHLKSQQMYDNVRKFMIGLVPGLYDDDNSIKESLNCVLVAHRRCSSGQICHHLEAFLQRVKQF